jgi:hypothetical protein
MTETGRERFARLKRIGSVQFLGRGGRAMKLTRLTAPVALCVGLVVPSGALAAGGPVPPSQGTNITVPGSPYRYSVRGAGHDTIVRRLAGGPGRPAFELRVAGRYGIPGVDFNGANTGLSADGRTLVLASMPRTYPPRTTGLVVLGAPDLAVRDRIAMAGWSTVDAISPDGRWLYLIHYPSSNISRYEVLAYDLLEHRLLTKPIVDPRDRGEAMTGFPIGRVMSTGGRWAYTLYFRASGVPFVHALDTAGRRAVCVDLPSLRNLNPGVASLSLTSGGAILRVDSGTRRALIDTRTFAVNARARQSTPAVVRPAPRRRRQVHSSSTTPWALIALSVAALAVLVATITRVAKPWRHLDRRPYAADEHVRAN